MKRVIQDFVCSVVALLIAGGAAQAADVVKIATVKSTAVGAVYVTLDKGYFRDAGIDIGSTGVSAQLYALAAQGAIKIFAGQAREHQTFQVNAFILSNAASAAGMNSLD